MPGSSSSGGWSSKPTARVSLACIPCRNHHQRCDAVFPSCSRCQAEGKECVYAKSRRGRPRRNKPIATSASGIAPAPAPAPMPGDLLIQSTGDFNPDCSSTEENQSESGAPGYFVYNEDVGSHGDDELLSLYYSFFHAAHPCVLPQRTLKMYLALDSEALWPLLSVLKYIGSLFAPSVYSDLLKLKAEQSLAAVHSRDPTTTGYDVQAVLLYSIAAYWSDEVEKSEELMDEAIRLALRLGMNRKGFATENGRQDPSLEESWRRTWWQLYITDAHIAGGTCTFPYRTSNVEMDVDLPCEEQYYETGNIPRPRTLEDYEMREFMVDDGQEFSSLAEFVGLTRAIDLAMAPYGNLSPNTSDLVTANVDAAATAWSSLLLASKKTVQRADGSCDAVLFKANALLLAYVTGLHRRLSTLEYSPIEGVARCPPSTPLENLPRYDKQKRQMHTCNVLLGIERFDALLILPTNILTHTPFIICMIVNNTIMHLAACRYQYHGQELRLARERIRMNMGMLKTLGEYWSLGKRTYEEVGVIARQVLCPVDHPKQNTVHTIPDIQPIAPVEFPQPDFPTSDPSFNLDDLYDLNFHEAIGSMASNLPHEYEIGL